MPGQRNPDTTAEVNIFTSRGIRWKRLRNISNPTFTAMKMKQVKFERSTVVFVHYH